MEDYKPLMLDSLETLKKLGEPIANWLKENRNPYATVIITRDSIRLTEDLYGTPIESGDHFAK